MTMRDLHNNTAVVRAVRPQTITSSNIASSGIDLQGFNAAEIVVEFGDIDEMGGSPVGAAKVDTQLEHSDDDVTYADVALADVIGPASVSAGIVSSVTTDADPVEVGYIGEKRYIRVTLKPTGLTNGGPIAALVIKGHPRHAPQ
ncbi:MAG: hypothetical protein V3S45_05230 [Kiloniellales bacterium]